MVLVFVYGTLKTGFPNHFLLKDGESGFATLIGSGRTVEKYPLVIATPFFIPMILNKPGTGENVSGEIYEVNEKMLEKLDELEANGRLYDRTPLKMEIADETMTCGTYVINNFLDSLLTLPLLSTYADASGYVSARESIRSAVDVAKLVKKSY